MKRGKERECRIARRIVELGLDGEASVRQTARLREHLKVCPECRRFDRAARSAQELARAVGSPAAPAGFDERLARRLQAERLRNPSPSPVPRLSPFLAGLTAVAAALAVVWLVQAAPLRPVGPATTDTGAPRLAAQRSDRFETDPGVRFVLSRIRIPEQEEPGIGVLDRVGPSTRKKITL